MKKLILTLFSFLTITSVMAGDITGEWNGVLSVQGMKLRLVFHILKTDNGYSATMDSPDQGAKGIAMTDVNFENNNLKMELKAAQIVYSGIFNNSDSIKGTFTQAGQKFSMDLSRKAVAVEKPRRIQEPVKPYTYISEDIKFENIKDNVVLAGTFTKPNAKGKFPVVILISGSGPQNRDEELLGHKPFLVLSDYLTRNGIAVLRYDDRGSFASTGNFTVATSFDFANDVEAAIQYLKTRKDIDPLKIGLIGHSEGGLIAPIVASRNKNVSFIILMAGPGIKGADILLLQQELIGRANGMKEENIQKTRQINSEIFRLADQISNTDSLKVKISGYLNSVKNEIAELDTTAEKTDNAMIEAQIKQLLSPWMLNFIRYNPSPVLEKIKCPVLAVIGSKDLQVPANPNLKAIEKALLKAGNKDFTVKELTGLNHLFQECKTGSPNEYVSIEQTISPVALDTILNWIKKHE